MRNPDETIVYLSGPMTGHELYNFPAFDQARHFLRSCGFVVLCPAEGDRELGFDPAVDEWTSELAGLAARRDSRAVSHADRVAVLHGFTSSRGARVEIGLARWIGIPVVAAFAPDWDLSDSVDLWLADGTLDDDLREFEGIEVPSGSEPLVASETGTGDPIPVSERRSLLEEAAELVDGDRNAQYGDPRQDFRRTAVLWTAYLDGKTELDLHDVAALMALLKLSRIRWSPEKRDSWADLAGYAACGWDCARPEET